METTRKAALGATLACLVLVPLCVIFLDRAIATFSHDVLARPRWSVALTHLADIPAPAATIGLVLAGAAYLAGWQPGPRGILLLRACILTLAALMLKDVLKFGFGRTWPDTWVDNNPSWIRNHVFGFFPFHGGRGYASFPSGHTVAVTTPCAALWWLRPLRPLLVALPLLVVTGLLVSDFHWLGDCVAGAFLAVAMGSLARVR
jgi:membrane-associated phospholipid phosphatase